MHPNNRLPIFSLLLLLTFIFSIPLHAQDRILLYTETGGYNHGTASASKVLMDSLGTAHGFTVSHDQNGDTFTEFDSLTLYKLIIFANTSGSNILDSTQRSNFEKYMSAGGNLMGIHAASDTYRHSTANGGGTGVWDYYAETLGASVQTGPNHTANLHQNFLDHHSIHVANDSLPNPWEHAEEYYYWENGYFDSLNNQVLLKVRNTNRGGQVHSYDSARAVSWIRDHVGGGKVFYTALGHNRSSYESDLTFKIHLRDAILALTAAPPPVLEIPSPFIDEVNEGPVVQIKGNPIDHTLNLRLGDKQAGEYAIEIWDIAGIRQLVSYVSKDQHPQDLQYAVHHLPSGIYFVKVSSKDLIFAQRILKR